MATRRNASSAKKADEANKADETKKAEAQKAAEAEQASGNETPAADDEKNVAETSGETSVPASHPELMKDQTPPDDGVEEVRKFPLLSNVMWGGKILKADKIKSAALNRDLHGELAAAGAVPTNWDDGELL